MEPNWKPLIDKLGAQHCVGFMFMGRMNGINMYKHGIVRIYLNLDDEGRCYLCRGKWQFEAADFQAELARIEAALADLGETLDSTYDNSYIEERRRALKNAGIFEERVEIEPEDWTIN